MEFLENFNVPKFLQNFTRRTYTKFLEFFTIPKFLSYPQSGVPTKIDEAAQTVKQNVKCVKSNVKLCQVVSSNLTFCFTSLTFDLTYTTASLTGAALPSRKVIIVS